MTNPAESYIEEAAELLAQLEGALLELEQRPDDAELVGEIFRAMHTIKGSGAMFGFDAIAAFTHELENAYDLVRSGRLAVSGELVTISLSACDRVRAMLDLAEGETDPDARRSEEILATLAGLLPEETGAAPAPPPHPESAVADNAGGKEATYRIRIRSDADLFRRGTDPLLLLEELSELGICSIVAHTREIPTLEELDPELCYTYWDVILTTDQGQNAIRDVFIFVEEECDIRIQEISGTTGETGETAYKKLGQILVERGDLTPEELESALSGQKLLGQLLVENDILPPSPVESALAEQAHLARVHRSRKAPAGSIRVPTEKLDSLVDLVGELVTTQARLSRKADMERDPELTAIAETVAHLAAELRDNAMGIRMLSIGTTFSKFNRLVRDLSESLEKEVVMTTEGGETELDKTMLERLNDPLVHLLRNSIDHGIELPSVRRAAGKSARGTVHLAAEHAGSNVLIRITDDGAGLDVSALQRRAVERGLIAADAELADEEIFALIFAPGFSTAQSVSDVSGRGVGMDVVKRNIESLSGSIEVASQRDRGTTITLRVPLTLAIIDGLLVETAGVKYVLPLSAIEECVELTDADEARAHGRNILRIREEIVPYIRLREHFHIPGERPAHQRVVISGINGRRVGIVVDRVIGEQQVVIKTMSRLYRDAEAIAGASIMGDGTVALILDVPKLTAIR